MFVVMVYVFIKTVTLYLADAYYLKF